MEYLPEKKRTQKQQIMKKEAKVAAFRKYLADEEIVLAIVKCKSIRFELIKFRFGCDAIPKPMARRPTYPFEGLLR